MKNRRPSGFTIFELMITVALAAVLMAIATPNLREFVQNNRLASTSNDLLRTFQLARSEAIKRRRTVVACGVANPDETTPVCTYDNTATGWIVFEDRDDDWQLDSAETIIQRVPYGNTDSGGEARFTALSNFDVVVSFNQMGFANLPNGGISNSDVIVLVDERGIKPVGTRTTARAVVISPTGNTRVSRDPAEVAAECSKVGLSATCQVSES